MTASLFFFITVCVCTPLYANVTCVQNNIVYRYYFYYLIWLLLKHCKIVLSH